MATLTYKFLHSLGKAVLNSVGGGILGDVLAEVLPELAKKAWAAWTKDTDDDERREELQALAAAPPDQVKKAVTRFVMESAGNLPEHVRLEVAAYLTQVPATLRQSFRRPADPTGRSVPAAVRLRGPEDLLPLLPAQMPRFKPGDRPLQGVDLELVELLGVGGFGEVWKARNPHIEGIPAVALKFCLAPEAKERLLMHEAKVLAQVMKHGKHPGIVQLQSTYLNTETPCLQYEYISGGDFAGYLRELHASEIPPTPQKIAELMLVLCDIVGYAHDLQPSIVHRDLKPANILVQRISGGGVRFKIADFGIGGLAASQSLQVTGKQDSTKKKNAMTSALRGSHTPLYASPQQAEGRDPDPRDDVFSLGVIWYQLLTGDLSAGRPGGTRWTERLGEKGVPRSHIKALTRCFEDSPSDRPANAGALADAIRAALEKHAAPPADAPDKKRKKKEPKDEAKQKQLLMGAGIGVGALLLLIVAIAVMTGSSGDKKQPAAAAPPEKEDPQPDKNSAAMMRGEEALKKLDADAAVKAFGEAVTADARHVDALIGRAKAYQLKKQHDLAVADATKALEINDKSARAYEQRALASYQRREYEKVLADAAKAFELAPPAVGGGGPGAPGMGGAPGGAAPPQGAALENPVRLYQVRATSCCYLGRYPEARADCNSGLRLEGNNVELLNLLGITYANQGDFDQAVAEYTKALAQQTDYLPARFNQGIAHGGFNRRLDNAVAVRAAGWQLPANFAWAFADQCPAPTKQEQGPAPSTVNGTGKPAGNKGGGNPGGGFNFGGFGGNFGGGFGNFGFGQGGVPEKPALLPSPLPRLAPPSIVRLVPSALAGPAMNVLTLPGKEFNLGVRGGIGPGGAIGAPPGFPMPPGGGVPGGAGMFGVPQGAVAKELSRAIGNQGNVKAALEDLAVAVQRTPDSPAAQFNLGWVSYSAGNFDLALRAFRKVRDLDGPSAAISHYYCGLTYLGKGDAAEADKAFSDALRLDSKYVWALKDRAIARTALKQYDDARADLDSAEKLESGPPALVFNRGVLHLHAGPAVKAGQAFDEVLKLDNRYVPAYLGRGLISSLQADNDQALLRYNQALNLDTRSAAAHLLRGRAFELKHEFELALQDYDAAVGIDPQYPLALILSGFSHCQRGDAKVEDVEKAITQFSNAYLLDPSDAMILVYRALAHYRKGEKGFAAADRDCTTALEKTEGKEVSAYLLRGIVRFKLKNTAQAIEDFNQALELSPNNIDALLKRSEVHADKKKYIDAIKDSGEALAAARKTQDKSVIAEALYYQATWRFLSNPAQNYVKGLGELNEAITLEPKNPLYIQQRGNFHARQGYTQAAEIDYATVNKMIAAQK